MIAASDRLSVLSRVTEIDEKPHDYSSGICDAGMEDLSLSLDTARALHVLPRDRMQGPRQTPKNQPRLQRRDLRSPRCSSVGGPLA